MLSLSKKLSGAAYKNGLNICPTEIYRHLHQRLLTTAGRPIPDILEDIHDVLDTIVRPYAQSDGGDVVYHKFDADEGTLWVRMQGACENCASSTVTLRFKVLTAMQHYCPEVKSVKRVDLDEDSDDE